MARYAPTQAAKTRSALVTAAARLMREKGIDGPSVADVMKSMGLTHGGFYAHFNDRSSLVEAAISEAIGHSPENFAFLLKLAEKQQTPIAIADAYLSDFRVTNLAESCPAAAFAGELHRQPESVRRAFSDGAERTSEVLGTIMPGQEQATDRGWGGLALLIGALILMRSTPDQALRHRIRDRVRKDFVKLTK
jgi:TetR/AcrR family transcriptional regulator, transcriptional repressor for nem operon